MSASDYTTASKMASSTFGGGPNRPVFVFPGNLDFYLEDQTTHKRVLTLYNPYDSDIIFKGETSLNIIFCSWIIWHFFLIVLCNNPKKYAVVEPEGRIAAQKCIDIVVRHVAVSPSAVQQTDKFRIQIFEDNSPGEVVGKRDVLATLHPGVYPQGKSLMLEDTKKSFVLKSLANEETKNFICIIYDVKICKIEVTNWQLDFFFTGVPDPSDSRHSASLPHHRANAAALMAPHGSSNETGNYANTLNEHSSIGKFSTFQS